MMKDKIIKILESQNDVSDWIIQEIKETKTESYYVGIEPENLRTVELYYCLVNLFNRHNNGMGDTTIRINTDQESQISKAVEEAIFIAKRISNPDFSLPVSGSYPELDISDPEIINNPWPIHTLNHDTLKNLASTLPSELMLASAELHLSRQHVHLTSSTGMDEQQDETFVIYDTVLVSETSRGESEQLIVVKKRRYQDIDIAGEIQTNSEYAIDKTQRNLPVTQRIPVVFTTPVINQLMVPIIIHASMEAKLKKYSRFKPGNPVFEDVGHDTLTLYGDAIRSLGLRSQRFDRFGIPGRKTTIILNGVFQKMWGSHDMASWLGISPTGSFGNISVKMGNTSCKNLIQDNPPVLRIIAFSDLIPNPVTGDFIAEIRLAYMHESSGKIPITGGAVSGNIFDIFRNATFSSETGSHENYYGPSAIRFENIQITG